MRVPRRAPGQPVQMTLLEPALVQPVILSKDQRRELDSALAQLLLSALQPSGQPALEGGEDAIEDYS
jgi:hypothetical protein